MPLILPIKTITPIWTGDNDRKTSYLRATSFLGGLRFWTESLLRSLGETVCSATGENQCVYNPNNDPPVCPACQIFGCTGLGRSFELKVKNEQMTAKAIGKVQLTRYQKTRNDGTPLIQENGAPVMNTPTWYLDAQRAAGLMGNFALAFNRLRPSNDSTVIPSRLALATHLLLHWGMLGTKDQYGYGLVEVTPPAEFLSCWEAIFEENEENTVLPQSGGSLLPNLMDFFYFSGKIKEEHDLPPGSEHRVYPRDIPFEIRYQVRSGLRDPKDKSSGAPLRHYFCGSTSGDRQATKFNMGLDGNTIYGWGVFPSVGPMARNRNRCLDLLKNTLNSWCIPTFIRWKEYNSHRDNCGSNPSWDKFLRELAEHPWR